MDDADLEVRLRRHLASQQRLDAGAIGRVRAALAAHAFARPRRGRPVVIAATVGLAAAVAGSVALWQHSNGRSGSVGGAPPTPAATPTTAPPTAGPTPTDMPSPAPTPTPVAVVGARTVRQLLMVDAQHGWLVDQDASAAATPNRVLVTADGGSTWHDVTPAVLGGTAFSLAAGDARRAWVVGNAIGSSVPGLVARTVDGGVTWLTSSIPSQLLTGEITFVDTTHLFTVGVGGAAGSSVVGIGGTDDAGATWHVVSTTDPSASGSARGVPFPCDKNGIGWRDARAGWATGVCNGGPEPVFLRTFDGGVTWAAQSLPVASGANPGGGAFSTNPPVFSSATAGQMTALSLATGSAAWYLYTTRDGGATWTFRQAPAGTATLEVSRSGAAVGVLQDGTLVSSADAGATWSRSAPHPELASSTGGARVGVDVVDGRTWFITLDPNSLGAGTEIFRTDDGGATVTRLSP